jgi:hypothetical protein
MSEFQDLPEGISINKGNFDLHIDFESELVSTIVCEKCKLVYECHLLTNASRHEGTVVINSLNSTIWKNALSKNRDKAIKNLKEALNMKFNRHKERCK